MHFLLLSLVLKRKYCDLEEYYHDILMDLLVESLGMQKSFWNSIFIYVWMILYGL
jgi:hypothetical protein